MRKVIVAYLVIITLIVSCYKNKVNTSTCDYDPCAKQAPANEIAAVESYLASAGITNATKHCSGMYYKIDSAGSDKTATVCSYISVNYKGMLTNGTVFDSTGTTASSLNLVLLIDGWKSGIQLIKKSGKIHLYIPPTLGYGSQPSGNIPPNSILIFDIQLVDIQ